MLAAAARPTLAVVAGFEVLRKIVQYSLSRPCREVLFTVLPREEATGAKLLLDTLVQRAGDAGAAALFELLSVRLGQGPRSMALVGAALALAWGACAVALGRMYIARCAERLPRSLAGKLHV